MTITIQHITASETLIVTPRHEDTSRSCACACTCTMYMHIYAVHTCTCTCILTALGIYIVLSCLGGLVLECWPCKPEIVGSNPAQGSSAFFFEISCLP